jgi:hypothetical protein
VASPASSSAAPELKESKVGSASRGPATLSSRTQNMKFMQRSVEPGVAKRHVAAPKQTAQVDDAVRPGKKLLFVRDTQTIVDPTSAHRSLKTDLSTTVSGRRSFRAFNAAVDRHATNESNVHFRDDVTPEEMAHALGINKRSRKQFVATHASDSDSDTEPSHSDAGSKPSRAGPAKSSSRPLFRATRFKS